MKQTRTFTACDSCGEFLSNRLTFIVEYDKKDSDLCPSCMVDFIRNLDEGEGCKLYLTTSPAEVFSNA